MESVERLVASWEQMAVTIRENELACQLTVEAWDRYREVGIEPGCLKLPQLTPPELQNIRIQNARLIEVTGPYIGLLASMLKDMKHIIALSDSTGWILELVGNVVAPGSGLSVGANWSEDCLGSNGIGTALRLGHPVFVYGVKHFGERHKGWGCLGVPIRENDNQIVGALNVSVPTERAYPESLIPALACVSAIEALLSGPCEDCSARHPRTTTRELLASAIHDLRNPMTVAKGLSQLGARHSESASLRSYFEQIDEQLDYVGAMLHEILEGFRQSEFENGSVAVVVDEAVRQVEPLAEAHDIKIEFEQLGPSIMQCKPKLLKRAVHNLLSNAIKATPAGGRVSVTVRESDDVVRISVADTGRGISEALGKKIFTPFVTDFKGGIGLGLF